MDLPGGNDHGRPGADRAGPGVGGSKITAKISLGEAGGSRVQQRKLFRRHIMSRAAIGVSLSFLFLATAASLAPAQVGYPGYYPGMGNGPGYYSLPNYYTNPTYSRGLYFPGIG